MPTAPGDMRTTCSPAQDGSEAAEVEDCSEINGGLARLATA